MSVFLSVNENVIDYMNTCYLLHTSLLKCSLSGLEMNGGVISMSAVQYEGPIPVLITAEC